jgi:hypothetical protein
MWDGGLEAVEAVIQWQQGMPAEGDGDGLFLRRQDGGTSLLRSHAGVRRGRALA